MAKMPPLPSSLRNLGKSGDAALADAEQAREQARVESPPALETLVAEVQDGPENVRANPNSTEAQLARALAAQAKLLEAFEKLQSNFESQHKRLISLEKSKDVAKAADRLMPPFCATCGQYVTVCHGDHVRFHVAPPDPDMWQFFEGIRWNGVLYSGWSIIPSACKEDIAATLTRWQRKEKAKFIDTGAVFGERKDVHVRGSYVPGVLPIIGEGS